MNILVIGAGGREHALAWKVAQDEQVHKVIVSPGNDGMEFTPKIQRAPSPEFAQWPSFCRDHKINFVIIGPENYLQQGLCDLLTSEGIPTFGPTKKAAELECSKAYAKEVMTAAGIPTAKSYVASEKKEAIALLDNHFASNMPVIKCDELAAGKGVFLPESRQEALEVLAQIWDNPEFPVHSQNLLFEERVYGREVSYFALCDGENFSRLGMACDHKRLRDGDQGPNTGGMGAYTPEGFPHKNVVRRIEEEVVPNLLKEMKKRNRPFKGMLFIGLMVQDEDFWVLEFNVRFGDPETQVLLPMVKGELYPWLRSCVEGTLGDRARIVPQHEGTALHVVLAAEGYPGTEGKQVVKNRPLHFEKGGLEELASSGELFFSAVNRDGQHLKTSGGRLLGMTTKAENLEKARTFVYEQMKHWHLEGGHMRKDIGLCPGK